MLGSTPANELPTPPLSSHPSGELVTKGVRVMELQPERVSSDWLTGSPHHWLLLWRGVWAAIIIITALASSHRGSGQVLSGHHSGMNHETLQTGPSLSYGKLQKISYTGEMVVHGYVVNGMEGLYKVMFRG